MSNREDFYIWLDLPKDENGNNPWTDLDTVVRKWAALTGLENDMTNYQKLKQFYA